jgi:2'-5' RNA ligase
MERIRAFIAIELPDEVKRALTRFRDRLKSGSRAPVRWTDPDGIHLTLKFLGDVDTGIIGNIMTAMTGAARGIPPFHLDVRGAGVFPDPGRVRVVWVGLQGEVDKLDRLQKNIESALKPLGFTPETRPFTPHLTLGRVRDQARPDERQELGRLVVGTADEAIGKFDVTAVHLIRSQLRPEGPIYTHLGSAELKYHGAP